MSDIVDRAEKLEQAVREDGLAAVRRRLYAIDPCTLDAAELVCVDCGDDIPIARWLAVPGCRRCIDCQTVHERRAA